MQGFLKLYWTTKMIWNETIIRSIYKDYVYSLIVPSAPLVNNQGWVGWKRTSKTPKSSVLSCPFNFFNGTMVGFCSKSLKKTKQEKDISTWKNISLITKKLPTCRPCHVKRLQNNRPIQRQIVGTACDKQQNGCLVHGDAVLGKVWLTDPSRTRKDDDRKCQQERYLRLVKKKKR